MIRSLFGTLVILSAGLTVDVAAAETPQELTYADALRKALASNPDLASAEANVVGMQAAVVTASGTFDPSFAASSGYSSSDSQSIQEYGQVDSTYAGLNTSTSVSHFAPTGTSTSLSFDVSQSKFRYELTEGGYVVESDAQFNTSVQAQVSQALLEGHKVAHNLEGVREARNALTEAELSLQSTRLQTAASAAAAYWELHYQQATVGISEEALRVAEEEHRITQARVEAGELAPVENTRAEAAVIEAKSNLLSARNARSSASDALSVVLGARPDGMWAATSEPVEAVPLAADEADVLASALEENPSLKSARLGLENAKMSLTLQRHGLLPQLDATASYKVEGYEASLADAFSEMTGGGLAQWYLGAEFSMPLGNRSDRGQLRSASATVTQYEHALRSAENALVQDLRAQLRSLRGAHKQVELAAKNVELADLTLRAEKTRQQQGRVLEKDVLDAQNSLTQAKVAHAKARTDYALALVELGRLKGRLDGVATAEN